MSTAILASATNSTTDIDFPQPSTRSTDTERKVPVVWGERSACRTQDVVRPGQRARVADRRSGAGVSARNRADGSRPGRTAVNYGRPSLSISTATRPVRRDVSAGTNLSRMMVVWTLGLGTFFGVLGGVVSEQGQQDIADATFTPTYASYSAE